MKIGINLVGVSYNDGLEGRYRNYEDAIGGLFTNIVNPLQKEGHEIFFYLFTYDSIKRNQIIESYKPTKYTFLDTNYNKLGGGNLINPQIKIMSFTYINSLHELINENLDLVISTRFDINFFKNPFHEFLFNFEKCNFLWREPEHTHLPIVNDTFIVFPHSMIEKFIHAIINMETNPPYGINIGMHNLYLPMLEQVGKEYVQWVCDEFINITNNTLYKLMRHE